MGELRLPVKPEHVTVLGSSVKPDSAAWTGLDWRHAEIRQTSWFAHIPDPHFSVVWNHPDDEPDHPDDAAWYRVRSRYESGRRYKINGRRVYVTAVRLELDPEPAIVIETEGGE